MVPRLAMLALGMAPAAIAADASASKSLLRGSDPESVMVGGYFGAVIFNNFRLCEKRICLALFFHTAVVVVVVVPT